MLVDSEKIFDKSYYVLVELAENFISSHIIRFLEEAGILEFVYLNKAFSVEHIFGEFKFCQKSLVPLKTMFAFLSFKGFVRKRVDSIKGSGSEPIYEINSRKFANVQSPESIQKEMVQVDEHILPFCHFTNFIFQNYHSLFLGKPCIDVMFSREGLIFWEDYFSCMNSGYNKYNLFGAVVGALNIKDGVICELGGGCGSGARELLCRLRDIGNISKIKKYVFSDASPAFLKVAKKTLNQFDAGGLNIEYEKINFNSTFDSQGIKPQSVDLFYGVNSFHAAYDLCFTLDEVYKSLTSGGAVVITECIRESNNVPFQEILFCFFDSYQNVKLSQDFRKNPGFISISEWYRLLEISGFDNVQVYSDLGGINSRYNYPLVGVLVGSKL